MALKSRLKGFYRTWLEPPGVREWREKATRPELQKFWSGTPVAVPPLEARYFRSIGLESATITRRDDSRPCAYVAGRIALPLPPLQPGDSVQVAVSADQWGAESSVCFRLGARSTRHVSLRPRHWLDVRLESEPGVNALELETTQPLWVSHPRIVRHRSTMRSSTPRHVLVLVMDGLSRRVLADRHPTDPERTVTPNLDRFFDGGFDAPVGFASSDWTLPTTASFFTGLYPSRHRMVHPTMPMMQRGDRKLLAEYFQERGYHTLALSTGNRLTPAFGSHRGFDRFVYHWPYEGQSTFDYSPAVWMDEIVGHLDQHRADSTFTYVHFPDTHPAWNIPPFTRSFNLARRGDSTGHDLDRLERSNLGREQGQQLLLLRLYELDRALGGLLRFIEENIRDETLVVLTSDHGTPWPDFPATAPKDRPSLNEFRLGTFMRIKGPGVPSERRASPVSPNLDLMPTLLGICGIEPPTDLDGKNLFGDDQGRSYLISEALYRDVYEIAVSDSRRQWIEKYPIDEQTMRLTGPAFYRSLFPTGCSDYSTPVANSDFEFETVVKDHIARIGIGKE